MGGGAVLCSFIFLTLDCVSYNYCISAVNGRTSPIAVLLVWPGTCPMYCIIIQYWLYVLLTKVKHNDYIYTFIIK